MNRLHRIVGYIHEWVKPPFQMFRCGAAGSALGMCPALAKAEGMVRFYREGQRPLAAQAWPAAIGAVARSE